MQFAIGEGEVESRQGSGRRANVRAECSVPSNLEIGAGIGFPERETAKEMIAEELMKVLKKNVRARDEIVPRRYGHIDWVLADANERCVAAIIQRLQARVEAHKGALCRELANGVTVRARSGAVTVQPLMKEMLGGKPAREASVAQVTLAVKERA